MHESPHYKLFHELVNKSYPVLLYIQGKNLEPSRIQTEWIPPVSLSELYKIQSLDYYSMSKLPELLEEFQEECMLYKVNVHASICYFIIEESKKLGINSEK